MLHWSEHKFVYNVNHHFPPFRNDKIIIMYNNNIFEYSFIFYIFRQKKLTIVEPNSAIMTHLE